MLLDCDYTVLANLRGEDMIGYVQNTLLAGLALCPPFIAREAFTSGTSWSSIRKALTPLLSLICKYEAFDRL